jgi:hypothetical protein
MSAQHTAVWFHDNGIGVFPIKTRSKEPACKSWDDYACTRDDAAKFVNYGVRLAHWIGVIDTDSPESEAWVQAHCPTTPFTVRGARGLHRYYRLQAEKTPKFIKRDGLTIEFRNQGQYVVGPGSVHPTGAVYVAQRLVLAVSGPDDLPAGLPVRRTGAGQRAYVQCRVRIP